MTGKYSRAKLVDYIVAELESGKTTSKLSSKVGAYLIETGKVSELDSVMRDAQELRAQKHGVVELTARSAHKLDAAQVSHIKAVAKHQYGTAKTVTLHQVKDQSVIGGANLTFPHSSLDLTIRAKLNQLRSSIS